MKIGILTHYYNSHNYGGMLQAYALTKVLNDINYDAEQICYEQKMENLSKTCVNRSFDNGVSISKSLPKQKKMRVILSYIKGTLLYCKKRRASEKEAKRKETLDKKFFAPRKMSFERFKQNTKHSGFSYSENTLFLTNREYDVFITGSDQVFNLAWQSPVYFLEFADKGKKKIAYAASAGSSDFDEIQKEYLRRVLPSFSAISVREQDLVDTYKQIAGVDSEWVLDPVLLLGKDKWDEVASQKLIVEPYVFCFFYDPTEEYHKICEEYAKQKNIKIATIPYAYCRPNKIDDLFGDYREGAASPEDFISLIKHAKCVITDSFHCAVFACMYDVPFFAFERKKGEEGKKMGSRLESLTQMFGCEKRFCNTEAKMTCKHLLSLDDKAYIVDNYKLMQKISREFLINSLKDKDGV